MVVEEVTLVWEYSIDTFSKVFALPLQYIAPPLPFARVFEMDAFIKLPEEPDQ